MNHFKVIDSSKHVEKITKSRNKSCFEIVERNLLDFYWDMKNQVINYLFSCMFSVFCPKCTCVKRLVCHHYRHLACSHSKQTWKKAISDAWMSHCCVGDTETHLLDKQNTCFLLKRGASLENQREREEHKRQNYSWYLINDFSIIWTVCPLMVQKYAKPLANTCLKSLLKVTNSKSKFSKQKHFLKTHFFAAKGS